MALSDEQWIAVHRVLLAVMGAGAGLGLWLLTDNWDDPGLPPALFLALLTFLPVYFGVALALAGPVPIGRALAGALLLALPVTALVSLAARGQVQPLDLLDDPVTLIAAAVLVLVATPFLLVWLQDRRDWRRYEALFEASWTITLRYLVAWVFVAVFWLVALLSNGLLRLVDIDVVARMLESNPARFGLTGAVLGLGLAVVYELRRTISPFVFLRLFRLLVPVVLAVVAVFLAAVPFRGLTDLFGEFSAAALLMGAALVSITLISTALDRSPAEEVRSPGLRAATQVLALVLPLLSGLAGWALLIRVREYGWTPDRVLAAVSALFLLAYGLGYCGAVLARGGWTGRIRTVNVVMALAVIAVSALWMTPVLDANRIATDDQIARYREGRSTLDQLPLWELAHEWGRPGYEMLAQLEGLSTEAARPDGPELATRLADLRRAVSRFEFTQGIVNREAPRRAFALSELMPVWPDGARISAAVLADLPSYQVEQWLAGCRRTLPDGRPGCVMVRGDFSAATDAEMQAMVLHLSAEGRARANFVLRRAGAQPEVRAVFDPISDTWPDLPGAVIAQALDGRFDIRPDGGKALWIGGAVLTPGN